MLCLSILVALASLILVSAAPQSNIYWTIKFWRFNEPVCDDAKLVTKKWDKLEASAGPYGQCKSWKKGEPFSAFRYEYYRTSEFNLAKSEDFGECDIFVWSEKDCQGEQVYMFNDANRSYKLCPNRNTCMEPGCNVCPLGACGKNFTMPDGAPAKGNSVSIKCLNL